MAWDENHPGPLSPMMNKREIVERVRAELRTLLARTMSASQDARQNATDEESRAVSKYDTQATETSYLAAGLASRAEDQALAIQAFENTEFPDFAPDAPIQVGALVEVDFEGEREFYLLATAGAGTSCEIEGHDLTVLAPTAPLAMKLLGARAGSGLKDTPLKIISVR